MEYQRLIWLIAEQTGTDEETVREVLSALPDVIMDGEIGEKTRTPLGVFTITERQTSKPVKTPTGHWGSAQPMVLARLKPGKKLRREASGSSTSPSPTPGSGREDPSA